MAELLILNSRPASDDAKLYKNGDVIAVFEDGHEWGRNELTERFRIVIFPGAAEKYTYLLKEETDSSGRNMISRRKYYINGSNEIERR